MYTQGEWKIGEGEIFRPASSGSISPYYKRICSFVNTGNTESKANAKLISAAPEMLDALQNAPIVSKFNNAEAFIEAFEKWRDYYKTPALKKATL